LASSAEPSLNSNSSGRTPASEICIVLCSRAAALIAMRPRKLGKARVAYCQVPAGSAGLRLDSMYPPASPR
jgi:hypothetical protein